MKTVVDHSRSSFTKTVFNDRFEYYAKDIGFKPIACHHTDLRLKGRWNRLQNLWID